MPSEVYGKPHFQCQQQSPCDIMECDDLHDRVQIRIHGEIIIVVNDTADHSVSRDIRLERSSYSGRAQCTLRRSVTEPPNRSKLKGISNL